MVFSLSLSGNVNPAETEKFRRVLAPSAGEALCAGGGGKGALTRIIHERSQRDRADGPYGGHPQGRESETTLNASSQGARPEYTRQRAQIRGRSRISVNRAGKGSTRAD